MENGPLETCVICLRISQEGEEFKSLFACDLDNTTTYLSKIRTLLGLEVFDQFSLICNYCKEDLNVAYEFRERLVHAHEYWSNNKHTFKQEKHERNAEFEDIKQEPCLSTEQDNITPEENMVNLKCGADEDAVTFGWKGLRCIKCKGVFHTAFVLSNHNCNGLKERKKGHLENKKYVCEHCNKPFKWRQSLNNHLINKHSDARNFHCDTCGKTFKIKAWLTRHMEGHRPHCVQKPEEDRMMCTTSP